MTGRARQPGEVGRLLTTEEVAERLRITPNALHQMVCRGAAPPSCRIGRRRLFSEIRLDEWIDRQFGGAA